MLCHSFAFVYFFLCVCILFPRLVFHFHFRCFVPFNLLSCVSCSYFSWFLEHWTSCYIKRLQQGRTRISACLCAKVFDESFALLVCNRVTYIISSLDLSQISCSLLVVPVMMSARAVQKPISKFSLCAVSMLFMCYVRICLLVLWLLPKPRCVQCTHRRFVFN